jgi:K+-transporting ATPase A subunit
VYALLLCWQGTPDELQGIHPGQCAGSIRRNLHDAADGSADRPGTDGVICAPKVLGLNGPGFTGADNAHPFENPTPLSQFLQLMLFFSIIAGLPYYYGRMINNTMHAWNIWAIMFMMLIAGIMATWYFESRPNPRLAELGLSRPTPTWKARKTRIGIYNSAAWANDVTATAEGANNCQHDSHDSDGRLHADVQHAHGRSGLWRDRQRVVRDAGLHLHLRLPRRADDRENARIPRQTDRGI